MEKLRMGTYQPLDLSLLRKHGYAAFLVWLAALPLLYFLPGLDLRLAGGIYAAFMSLLAVLDYCYGLLYDRLLLPLALMGWGLEAAGVLPSGLEEAFWSASAAAGILLMLRFLSGGGLGLGDVKFVAVLGLWLGSRGTAAALTLSILLGALWAIALLMRGHRAGDILPFGPCLSLGGYLAYIFSDSLWQLYWDWLL